MSHQQGEHQPQTMTTTYGSLSVTIPYPGHPDEQMAVELITTPRRNRSMFGTKPVLLTLLVLLLTTIASFVAISARSPESKAASQPPSHQVVLDREQAWWNPFSWGGKGKASDSGDDASSSEDKGDDADHPGPTPAPTLPHATSCGDCTLEECKPLLCDLTHTPYTCTAGFSKGGCAPSQNAFTNPNCQKCCSLSKCVEKAPPCPPCQPSECLEIRKTCGLKRPYACTAGQTMGACSDDAKEWPLNILKGTCQACCDVSKCPPVDPCGPCSPEDCAAMRDACGTKRPWACVEGPSKGGCAAKESYWTDAELTGMCTKCCSVQDCPKPSPPPTPSPKAATSVKAKSHLKHI